MEAISVVVKIDMSDRDGVDASLVGWGQDESGRSAGAVSKPETERTKAPGLPAPGTASNNNASGIPFRFSERTFLSIWWIDPDGNFSIGSIRERSLRSAASRTFHRWGFHPFDLVINLHFRLYLSQLVFRVSGPISVRDVFSGPRSRGGNCRKQLSAADFRRRCVFRPRASGSGDFPDRAVTCHVGKLKSPGDEPTGQYTVKKAQSFKQPGVRSRKGQKSHPHPYLRRNTDCNACTMYCMLPSGCHEKTLNPCCPRPRETGNQPGAGLGWNKHAHLVTSHVANFNFFSRFTLHRGTVQNASHTIRPRQPLTVSGSRNLDILAGRISEIFKADADISTSILTLFSNRKQQGSSSRPWC